MRLRKWYKVFYKSRLDRPSTLRGRKPLGNADMKTANTRLLHKAGRFYDEVLKRVELIEIYVHRQNQTKKLNAGGCKKVGRWLPQHENSS
jgi:hypothetical protein